MKKFIEKALANIQKLTQDQVLRLIHELSDDSVILEMVLTSIPAGIIVADNDGKCLLANSQARRLLPLKSGDLNDHPMTELFTDTDVQDLVQDAMESNSTVRDRVFILEKGNRTLYLNCNLLPLVRDGIIKGTLLYVEDITEKRADQARLRRAENLAALATMTAGVAHEIKNPLGSIGIYIQLLQKTLKNRETCEENRKEMEEYLDILEEEVERLNSIVVNYLFAVRPIEIDTVPSDVNTLLRELMDFVRYELEEHQISASLELCREIPKVSIDEKLIKQSILNLIKNAQSAMPLGGDIHVKTGLMDGKVCLSVSDTGQGISDDNLEKIFEPYFTTRDSGSGLGLTMVYKIIKEHGGDIQVRSELNKGTTFLILLPIPQKEQHLVHWKGSDDDV